MDFLNRAYQDTREDWIEEHSRDYYESTVLATYADEPDNIWEFDSEFTFEGIKKWGTENGVKINDLQLIKPEDLPDGTLSFFPHTIDEVDINRRVRSRFLYDWNENTIILAKNKENGNYRFYDGEAAWDFFKEDCCERVKKPYSKNLPEVFLLEKQHTEYDI